MREGDNARVLAEDFVVRHNLNPRRVDTLAKLVKDRIEAFCEAEVARCQVERHKGEVQGSACGFAARSL